MKTAYEQIFEELSDCTYQGFIDNHERECEFEKAEARITKLETELAIYKQFYQKWYRRYHALVAKLEARNIYVEQL